MSDTLLEVRNLTKTYDNGVHALKNVSFTVKKGEFLSIIGLSGSGKSTLLRCLNRLVEPTSGQIILEGKDITKLPINELRHERKKIGMIFQHFNLVKRKSVLTNVLTGTLSTTGTLASLFGQFPEEEKTRALEFLKVVGLESKARIRADQLSGGQQQRVAIARALMQDPHLLLADEPVASLDPATSHSILDHLRHVNRGLGKTVVCNLHFLSLVREYSTRVIALKGGEIIFEGSPQEITDNWFGRIYGDQAKEVEIR